jgi:hypothetical protein
MPAHILLWVAAAAAISAFPARAEMIGGNPGPQYNYICPNADGKGALDCYFDAVAHLYTMCKHVKAIEIIEFGYEKADEGVNGAKSGYCLDKQKLNITRPYQAALREASVSRQAVEGVQSLQEYWLQARRPQMASGRIRRRVQGARRAAVRRFPRADRRHPQDRGDYQGKHDAHAKART